mmetsp:Transcript_12972/g.17086  ORF Transcript_12972/g.17086 Transcript_12972/m.17086 type:complete len:432 (-) Transcript_12972:142-1437(-)
MNSDDETEKIRVKFVTKLASIRVTEMPIAVPINLGRYGLSEVVNHLLDKSPPIPFEFLIENRLLRIPLEKYMQGAGISGESVVTLEYFPAAKPPDESEGPELPDWVSSLHGDKEAEEFSAGCYDGVFRIFGIDGSPRASVTAHRQPISVVRMVSQRLCLSASKDRTIKSWLYQPNEVDLENGSLVPQSLYRGHTNSIESLDCSPDGSKFASGDWDGGLCIWKSDNGDEEGGIVKKQKQSKQGSLAASLREQAPLVSFKAHQQCISSLIWAKTGDLGVAFTASWDHSIRTWDMERQDCVHTLNGSKVISSLAFSAENSLLASSHPDHRIRLWDSRGKSEALIQATLTSHKQWVSDVHWIEGARFLLSSTSYDGELKLWDIRSHIPLYTSKAHKDKGLCVHSQGNRIYTGGSDGLIKIFGIPSKGSSNEVVTS